MKRLPPAILILIVLPATAGLVAHYPLDGSAQDTTVGAHHLTGYAVNGVDKPELVASGGRSGGFARFDGQNLFNTTWLPVTGNGDRTLMFFIRTRGTNAGTSGTTTQFFGGWGSPDLGTRVRFDLGFEAASNSKLRAEFNSGFLNSSDTTALNGGMWHHLAISYVGSTKTATFYLNGTAYGSAVAAGTLNTGGGTPDVGITLGGDTRAGGVRSGASTQTPNRFFKGDIDEVRVYDTALTQGEIQTYLDDLRDNGPQIVFFESDLPLSPPGVTRTLRYQLSAAVTTADLDHGLGTVLPVDAFGYGTVTVTPTETTTWTLATARGLDIAQATATIEVSSTPQVRSFSYQPAITRSKLWVFLPQSAMNYRVVRGTTLDSFPDVIQSFTAPTLPFVEVRDTTAPAGRAFYRLEEIAP